MTDLNVVALSGRVVKDAELKIMGDNKKLLLFTIATNRDKKEKNTDSWVSVPSFFPLKIWGNQAEGLRPFLKKGQQVNVDAHLEMNTWEKEGEKQSQIVIVPHNVTLVGFTKSKEITVEPQEIDITPEDFDNYGNDASSLEIF